MPNGSLDSDLYSTMKYFEWPVRHRLRRSTRTSKCMCGASQHQASNVLQDLAFEGKLGVVDLARLMDHDLAYDRFGKDEGYMVPECFLPLALASKVNK